jgi:uncharacterized membrane protein SpoIIM required for sporulation
VFEQLWRGQTPGKRLMSLRVVSEQGTPPTWMMSVIRNAVRLVDNFPLGYTTGTSVLIATGDRRIGDVLAGTVVIVDQNPIDVETRAAAHALLPFRKQLHDVDSDTAFHAVEALIAAHALPAPLRAAAERNAAAVASNRRVSAWIDVVAMPTTDIAAVSHALMRAAAAAVPYALLATPMLQVMRAQMPAATVSVSAFASLRRFLRSDVPVAVRTDVALVKIAAALFAVGAVKQGANWTDAIESSGTSIASSLQIIFNNLLVALRLVLFGVLVVPAALMLVGNGMTIGAVVGMAAREGTSSTLLRFLVAHGPVEFTAVCIAGGAGFCVARAWMVPGMRTRARAFRDEAQQAVRLLTATVVLLVCIGTVEGFVSPGTLVPFFVQAAVSVVAVTSTWRWLFVKER